jgi:hypothetical protein
MRFSIRSRAVAWPAGWTFAALQAGNDQFQALPPPVHI